VIQANFNLIDQRAVETGLYALAEKTGVGVICRTPLVFGFLTKQISGETKFEAGDHRANWPKDQLDRWTESAGLFDFLQKNRTAVQAALRFFSTSARFRGDSWYAQRGACGGEHRGFRRSVAFSRGARPRRRDLQDA
jgi:aryl-alcohol dehydrogenase-like predicted oxidoreductase